MDNWLDAVQNEVSKIDPMLRIRLNEVSIALFNRGIDPELSALMYIDQFKADMILVANRLLNGLSTTNIQNKWSA